MAWETAVVIAGLGASFLFAYIGNSFKDSEYWFFRFFFIILALFFILITIGVGINIMEANLSSILT